MPSASCKRASEAELQPIFDKYASLKKDGKSYMTTDDFVRRFLELFPNEKPSNEIVSIMAGIADADKDGQISFKEFTTFEELLCTPAAVYEVIFQMFDRRAKGKISFSDFAEVIRATEQNANFPFNFDSQYIRRYFGADRHKKNDYFEFSQLLRDYAEEYNNQAFIHKDDGSGYISIEDFQNILLQLKRRILTPDVKKNLSAIPKENKVSFAYYKAFTSILDNIESVKDCCLAASGGKRGKQVPIPDLLRAGQIKGVTPEMIEVIFDVIPFTRKGKQDTVSYSDIANITPHTDDPINRSLSLQILEGLYRFGLGSIAGGTGAAAVYPMDLVKTRMQNQRTDLKTGKKMYKNSLDCFLKTFRNEGAIGLYRGLSPQLIGISPEKAIKLTVNDIIRGKFTDANGNIPFYGELLGGMGAGCFQVIITNPLEIIKIRVQVSGEIKGGPRVRPLDVMREIGIKGMYKGIRACLLRDVHFATIYFPTYAHIKAALADKDGYNSPITLLMAGALAGIPAASLVTPFDVVKTRLQVNVRPGQVAYKGIFDAFRRILREEGITAFGKGAAARVCRSSPQFGITLITYELLQRFFYVDFGGNKPKGSQGKNVPSADNDSYSINPDHIGGYKRVVPILNSIESKFGLCLPRFGRPMK